MFVSTMNNKGYTNDPTGSTRQMLIIPKDMDNDDMLTIDVKRLFSLITVRIDYVNGTSRILTLNRFKRAKFYITKRLKKKINRIVIYDTVEELEGPDHA